MMRYPIALIELARTSQFRGAGYYRGGPKKSASIPARELGLQGGEIWHHHVQRKWCVKELLRSMSYS